MDKRFAWLHTSLQDLRIHLSYLPRSLHLVWAAAPRWTTVWMIMLVVQGLLPVASIFMTKLVVDSLAGAIATNGNPETIRTTMLRVVMLVGLLVLFEVVRSVTDWIRTSQAEFIQDYISGLVHERSIEVDLAYYESPDYYDSLDRARSESGGRSLALLESVGSFLQNSLTLLGMSVVLLPYGSWLPLILLISTLPALYVVLQFDRRYHLWWKQTTTRRRLVQYYDLMLTNSAAAAEVRLFGLGKYFRNAHQALRRQLRAERLSLTSRQSFARLGAGGVALLISGVTIGWMVERAIQGLVTMGDLVLFYQAFSRGQDLMRSLLGSIGHIYNNSVFLGNLFAFLELKPTVTNRPNALPAPNRLEVGIQFRQVTFRYPRSKRAALQNFDLTIPSGKIVAIVGANGAGKTTLLKLLCRFYDPDAGSVTLDGIDLRDLSLEELRRQITVLFQFPMPYQTTAAENIALGNIQESPDLAQLEAAARSAGAHDFIARLPNGYQTQLGTWFHNGVELSGGEWQRIAMARAYLRQSPIFVLDEPTSAMDSWAEADWFERLRALANGRTGLIITHRFTIAMRADIIHVMDQGRIVESGTHQELLAYGGRYAESWAAQMRASLSTEADALPVVECV